MSAGIDDCAYKKEKWKNGYAYEWISESIFPRIFRQKSVKPFQNYCVHPGDFVNIKNFVCIVEILDRKSRFFGNAEYYYLHNAPRIVEIIVLHCSRSAIAAPFGG